MTTDFNGRLREKLGEEDFAALVRSVATQVARAKDQARAEPSVAITVLVGTLKSRIAQMGTAGAALVWVLESQAVQEVVRQLSSGTEVRTVIAAILTAPSVGVVARRAWMIWRDQKTQKGA